MLNNFIYAKTKSLFEEKLANNEILPEAIVFIEDTKEIWNHGTYFGASDVDLDSMMSDTSENGVQNKVIKEYIDLHSRYEQVDNIDAPDFNLPTVVVDSFISSTSTNPVQNKTIKAELDKKLDKNSVDATLSSTSTNPVQNKTLYTIVGDLQPTLQSGVNIKTINGKSILGEGNIVIESSSTNDFTTSEKNKLAGIAEGAEVNIQSDWNATSGDALILNKPGVATQSAAGFMSAADKKKLDGIATGAEANVQSDWNATSGDAFIKNKPSLATVATSGSYNDLSNKPIIPLIPESLKNPHSLTFGTKTYDGSSAKEITASDLGLSSALKYCGITTTALTDGATTNPIVISGTNHTATAGCVVFYEDKEFVFNGSKWEELGYPITYSNSSLGNGYATCSTAAATVVKTVSLANYSVEVGGMVSIRFTNGNTVANPTLNINSKGGKAIYYKNAALTDTTLIGAGDIVTFVYSTYYYITSILKADQTLTLTGDVTASASVDPNKETISIATTLANSGVTAGSYGPSANASPTYSGTFSVPYLTVDAKGRLTSASTKTITLPAQYSLPLAASGTRGGVQIGYSESGANIPLKLSSEKGYVTLTKNSVTSALGYTPPTTNTTYTAGTNVSISSSNVISATDTTYSTFVKSGSSAAAGLVPKPSTTAGTTKYLREDGTWVAPPNTTYSAATQSAAGLLSAADKKKLDGIASGANAYSLPLSANGTRGGIQIGYSSTTKTNLPVKLSSEKAYVTVTKDAVTTALGITPTANTGTVTSITPGTGLTGTSSDSAITGSGTINLKTATTSEIGGIKPAAVRTSSISSTTGGTTSGRYYGVELDSNGKAFVNVPWISSNIQTKTISSKGTAESPVILEPNVLTIFSGSSKSLYVTFTEGKENEHYMIQFVPGTNTCTISLPDTVKWFNGIIPDFYDDQVVQISIFNNMAVGGGFV